MHKKILITLFGASVLMLGCPAEEDGGATATGTATNSDDDEDESDGETDDASDTAESQTTVDTNDADTQDADTNDADTNDADTMDTMDTDETTESDTTMTGIGFIEDPDGGGVSIECSVWDQDCDEGQKCAPWANDGGNAWNATKCVPIDPAMNQPGDACSVEGSGVSGVDSCDVSSMCWNVDGKTNMGTCVAFCTGSEAAPVCDNPSTSCSIANEGVLILCLPTCDPNLQDCPEGEACYGIDTSYVCAPDASGEMGAYPDPCEFINACDAGSFCLDASLYPTEACDGASGCCTPTCIVGDPGACPGAPAGVECVPWFQDGERPPPAECGGSDELGICSLP